MATSPAELEAAPEAPRVIHSLPGRIRIHVPEAEPDWIERRVSNLPGVERARASWQTHNVLVNFDPARTQEQAILTALGAEARAEPQAPDPEQPTAQPSPPGRVIGAAARGLAEVPKQAAQVSKQAAALPKHAVREVGRLRRRARIAVRGIDRDPELARRVVDRLGSLPGVSRVTASQLTGRVLVEYSHQLLNIEDLLSQVIKLELPELPGEDTPAHPLDPAPLIQSTARVIGSGLGLTLIGVRRAVTGIGPEPDGGAGAHIAGAVGIIEGLPPIERRVEQLIGRNGAQLGLSGLTIISLTFAGSPLGLALNGAAALRLMTMVRARQRAWRRYEQRLDEAEPANPGAEVEIEPGERTPLGGTVQSGYGTAISAGGEVLAAAPGEHLDAGARLFGGPVTVELDCDRPFAPSPRATPPTPTIYDRYLGALPPASLAYAAVTGLLTRSPSRALTALLLVNPRAALIGAESAENAAAARVLRQGVTVVGSRERRPIAVPDALVIESPRVLTDGLVLAEVAVTSAGPGEAEVRRIAAGISAAAGSPWGSIFNHQEGADAIDGTFDGRVASAEIDGERWLLRPRRRAPAGSREWRYQLELRPARLRRPVATLALRLAPAPGLEQLLETCRRLLVPVEVVGSAAPGAAALAASCGVRQIEGDALDRLRDIQATGGIVAVVSDRSHAGPEFAECDLAIGLSSGRSGHFAARADLLAPDLSSVAAIIEAGGLRDVSVRDSVILSGLSNVAGCGAGAAIPGSRAPHRPPTWPRWRPSATASSGCAVASGPGRSPSACPIPSRSGLAASRCPTCWLRCTVGQMDSPRPRQQPGGGDRQRPNGAARWPAQSWSSSILPSPRCWGEGRRFHWPWEPGVTRPWSPR